jgi:uncharacterized membrane protein
MFVLLALFLIVAVTVIGLVSYWPNGHHTQASNLVNYRKTERAKIVQLTRVECRTPGQPPCTTAKARLETGPDRGQTTSFTLGLSSTDAKVGLGDEVQVAAEPQPPGSVLRVNQYDFVDFDRLHPLYWLAGAFALLVLVTGRLRGLRALLGLAASFFIVLKFLVPAAVDGEPPVTLAIIAGLAIVLTTIPLAHGLGAKALSAILGTTAALAITAGLAEIATHSAHLTGISNDETVFLKVAGGNLSLTGLLLCGMVIGALGVLDDLTVTQASTVMALRRTNPTLGFKKLTKEALDVGHDHIAATVNTLVLAYAGAALPTLLIFSIGSTPDLTALNTEQVAEQVVATLVGSIGLVLAVPITTTLAALLATRLNTHALQDTHAHQH